MLSCEICEKIIGDENIKVYDFCRDCASLILLIFENNYPKQFDDTVLSIRKFSDCKKF
jgi:hypothetical protein